MVLGEAIEDAQGVRHAMVGLLGHATSFAKRRLHLGYRQARLARFGKNFGDAITHLTPGAHQVFRSCRQAANHQHQALRAQRVRFFDRATIVVAPVLGGEEPAAAKARDRQSFFSDGRRGGLQTHGGDLIAPG